MVLPGATHAVPDSHASTVGGLGAHGVRLRHHRAGAHPRHASDRDEAAEVDAHPARRHAGRARHRQGRGAEIIAALGMAGGRGHVVEYAGSAVRAMAMEGRMTLCNLNIEMGGRSGFVAPDEGTFDWIAGRPFAPQGAQWDQALAHWRTLKSDDDANFDTEHAIDCSSLEPQITWGTDPSQVVGISGRVPDPASDPEPARDRRRRARLHGPYARHAARGPADQPRVHRLLHQCAAARPRGRRRRGARAACRRRRGRAGGAGLVVREARGRGQGPRQGVPRRRLCLGRIRLLDVRRRQWRPRRAGRAHRLHHQPQFREPPGPEDAHASREPRHRGRQRDRRPHRRRAQLEGAA